MTYKPLQLVYWCFLSVRLSACSSILALSLFINNFAPMVSLSLLSKDMTNMNSLLDEYLMIMLQIYLSFRQKEQRREEQELDPPRGKPYGRSCGLSCQGKELHVQKVVTHFI